MNTFLKCTSALAVAMAFAAAHASPPSVNPEQMDLDPDISAKILKEKAKRNPGATPAGNSTAGAGGSSGCGQVNINSANSSDKKSASGLSEMFGKQSTTVITGPVINMANCK